MHYGICPISLVAVREAAETAAPMSTQLLFGEHFKVLEIRKYWSKIRTAFDKHEGWIPNTQYTAIPKEAYTLLEDRTTGYSSELISHASDPRGTFLPILLGSQISSASLLNMQCDGPKTISDKGKAAFVDTALLYLNSPELSGGKSPFGIDAPGFCQMVYKIHGIALERSAEGQSKQGVALSFVEESEAGDLAFFDNSQGEIDHVGMIMENNYIIHVNGKVRIDRIDHTGIFNNELRTYTHALRVIKKII